MMTFTICLLLFALFFIWVSYRTWRSTKIHTVDFFVDIDNIRQSKYLRKCKGNKELFYEQYLSSNPYWPNSAQCRRFLFRYLLGLNPYKAFPIWVEREMTGKQWQGYYTKKMTMQKLAFYANRKPLKRIDFNRLPFSLRNTWTVHRLWLDQHGATPYAYRMFSGLSGEYYKYRWSNDKK